MKTNQIVIGCMLFIFVMGCKSSSMALRSNSDTVQAGESTEGRSIKGSNGGETTDNNSGNAQTENVQGDSGSVSTDAAQYNGSTGANSVIQATGQASASSTDYSAMYAAIGMTEQQVAQLEAGMKRFMKTSTTTANGEMMGSVESERERQLKSILTDQQYKKYGDWKAENQ
tara:strand:- start:95361 stop:95873 length:513 start_codon:yes stop_codon:yes gene_type:complete